jgi:hypothetical protein
MSSINMMTPSPPEKYKQGSFDFSLSQPRLPENKPDFSALSRKGATRLILTLRWKILNKLPITKAELDEIFKRPGKGVWSWGQTLRKLNSISKELYGANGEGKPLRPVYRFNKISDFDGEYIFLMGPREILAMLKRYEKKRKEKEGGTDV